MIAPVQYYTGFRAKSMITAPLMSLVWVCPVLFTHDMSARGKRRAKLEGCGWGLFAASARPLGAELRTWRGRLPQELRLARIGTLELANIAEFNDKFAVPAKEKGTAFWRTSRPDLNWVFTVQTERVVAKDNT
jgi:hypothetical protein